MNSLFVGSLSLDEALDPRAQIWRDAMQTALSLAGTPATMQPSEAIRASWATKTIGRIAAAQIAVANSVAWVAFRLRWADPHRDDAGTDIDQFPDAAGILLPVGAYATLITMGSPGLPVEAWYWRADDPDGQGRQVLAEGLGSTTTQKPSPVKARAAWTNGRWEVVLARPLRARSPAERDIKPGQSLPFGVAIWDGANHERAGLKSITSAWNEVHIASG